MHVGGLFRDYLPVSDILLGRCMAELEIKLYSFDVGGWQVKEPSPHLQGLGFRV